MKKAMGTITTWLNDFTDLLKALIVLGILVGILYNDIFGVIAGIGKMMNDIGDGGLVVAMAESSISSGLGASLTLPSSQARLDRLLFAEGGARVLISCSQNQSIELNKYYKNLFSKKTSIFALSHLGNVNDQQNLLITQSKNTIIDVNISDLKNIYKNTIYKKISK